MDTYSYALQQTLSRASNVVQEQVTWPTAHPHLRFGLSQQEYLTSSHRNRDASVVLTQVQKCLAIARCPETTGVWKSLAAVPARRSTTRGTLCVLRRYKRIVFMKYPYLRTGLTLWFKGFETNFVGFTRNAQTYFTLFFHLQASYNRLAEGGSARSDCWHSHPRNTR